jgi:hypothetical protein
MMTTTFTMCLMASLPRQDLLHLCNVRAERECEIEVEVKPCFFFRDFVSVSVSVFVTGVVNYSKSTLSNTFLNPRQQLGRTRLRLRLRFIID